jgi:hypothetical protein
MAIYYLVESLRVVYANCYLKGSVEDEHHNDITFDYHAVTKASQFQVNWYGWVT